MLSLVSIITKRTSLKAEEFLYRSSSGGRCLRTAQGCDRSLRGLGSCFIFQALEHRLESQQRRKTDVERVALGICEDGNAELVAGIKDNVRVKAVEAARRR